MNDKLLCLGIVRRRGPRGSCVAAVRNLRERKAAGNISGGERVDRFIVSLYTGPIQKASGSGLSN